MLLKVLDYMRIDQKWDYSVRDAPIWGTYWIKAHLLPFPHAFLVFPKVIRWVTQFILFLWPFRRICGSSSLWGKEWKWFPFLFKILVNSQELVRVLGTCSMFKGIDNIKAASQARWSHFYICIHCKCDRYLSRTLRKLFSLLLPSVLSLSFLLPYIFSCLLF